MFVWDGIHLGSEGAGFEDSPPVPELVTAVAGKLSTILATRAPGPIRIMVAGFCLHGHALGKAGTLICGFPPSQAAAIRSYARGLCLLTGGRIRLVPHKMLLGRPKSGKLLLQGPAGTLHEASQRMAEFRGLLRELSSTRMGWQELAFAELAANTVRYGLRGRMAVYGDHTGLSIWARDDGPGIPLHLLPSCLLVTGYTTNQKSLGAGFPTIVRLANAMSLATGEEGTIVLIRLNSVPLEVE